MAWGRLLAPNAASRIDASPLVAEGSVKVADVVVAPTAAGSVSLAPPPLPRWSVGQSLFLCAEGQESTFLGRLELLDRQVVSSVKEAVALLNQGVLSCSGSCVVFSARRQAYYVVFPADKIVPAFTKLHSCLNVERSPRDALAIDASRRCLSPLPSHVAPAPAAGASGAALGLADPLGASQSAAELYRSLHQQPISGSASATSLADAFGAPQTATEVYNSLHLSMPSCWGALRPHTPAGTRPGEQRVRSVTPTRLRWEAGQVSGARSSPRDLSNRPSVRAQAAIDRRAATPLISRAPAERFVRGSVGASASVEPATSSRVPPPPGHRPSRHSSPPRGQAPSRRSLPRKTSPLSRSVPALSASSPELRFHAPPRALSPQRPQAPPAPPERPVQAQGPEAALADGQAREAAPEPAEELVFKEVPMANAVGLVFEDMEVSCEAFDPCSDESLKALLIARLGFGQDATIRPVPDNPGGFNNGTWFLEDDTSLGLVLKLVPNQRRAPTRLTDTEKILQLLQVSPGLQNEHALSLPVVIFHISGADSFQDLLVMRKAPGVSLAHVMYEKYYGNHVSELWPIFREFGRFLCDVHACYGMQHGDCSPSNVFYDPINKWFTMIDVADMGPNPYVGDNDVDYFIKGIQVLAQFYTSDVGASAEHFFVEGYRERTSEREQERADSCR